MRQRHEAFTDGSFSGKLVGGAGITAQLLMDNGFQVIDVEDLRMPGGGT